MVNVTDCIIRFEEGSLAEEEVLELFQHLVNTGMAWQLQGFYGRTAQSLLDQGLISLPPSESPTEAATPTPVAATKKRRGRKSGKQVGALVEMSNRRLKGQGIILERVEDVPYDGHKDYHGIIHSMKCSGYVGYGVKGSDHHNFVLVQWFSPPSDYTSDKSHFSKQWFPDKWVKVISPAAKVIHEKAETKK